MKDKIIYLGGISYQIINLTEPLRQEVEVYPGDPKPVKKVFSKQEDSGFNHNIWSLGEHNFHPHGDAPLHYQPNQTNQSNSNKSFDKFGIDYFFNSALIIDLSEKGEIREGIKYLAKIKREDLEPFKEKLSKKTAIIIRTGYDRWLEANKKHTKTPELTKEAAEYLAQFSNLRVIGTDSLTIGNLLAHLHLSKMLIVESLVNLYSIPVKEFDLQTFPIAVEGSTGGPIAAMAFVRK